MPTIHPALKASGLATLLLSLVLTTACVHHEPRQLKGFFARTSQIVGHRGAKGVAPENTMASFRAVAKLGLPFELDTMLSKDGVPVVIHDYTVDRTTNGTGKVADLTVKELKALDAGSHFSKKFKGEKIPTLAEVLDAFAGKVKIDIEIKYKGPAAGADRLADAIVDLIEARGLEDRVFVTAFNPNVLAAMVRRKPGLIRGQLYSNFENAKLPYYQKVVLRNLMLNGRADPDLLAPRHSLIDQAYMTKYHGLGYKVVTWTVNKPERIRELVKLGVDGIITDFPARALKIRMEAK